MATVYHDLSGDTELLAAAFPAEKDAIRTAIAQAAGETDYYEQFTPDQPPRIWSWTISHDAFNRAIQPWAQRLHEMQDAHRQIVHFLLSDYYLLLDDDAIPLPCSALRQVRLEAIYDDEMCLLRDAQTGERWLQKSCLSLAQYHGPLAARLAQAKTIQIPAPVLAKSI